MKFEEKQIRQASLSQLTHWWSDGVPDSAESTVRFRIWVVNALVDRPEGIAFLKHQLQSENLKKHFTALQDLTNRGILDQEVMGHVLKAFQAEEPILKLCALSCLRHLKQYSLRRDAVEELIALENILDGDLAAEAMLYHAEAFPESTAAILGRGLRSDNKYIRGTACDGAWENKVFELLPELNFLQDDPDVYVANEARTAVDMLRFYRTNSDKS